MRNRGTRKGRRWTGIASAAAACLVVGLLAALLIGGHGGGTLLATSAIPHDGLRLTAVANCPQTTCSLARAFSSESSVLTHRFSEALNAKSVSVRQISATELTIELQGVTDIATVEPLLAQGSFAILDAGGQYLSPGTNVAGQTCTTTCTAGQYKIVFTGSQLDPSSISVAMDPQTGQPVLTFAFAGSTRQAFAQYTRQNIGQYLTIALDNVVIESATIQSAIAGSGQILGWKSLAQARQAAALLKSGPLAVPFKYVMVAQITPNGAVSCSATPVVPPYPASTPTPPPDATPEPPTPTPWPNPTPIPTGTPPATPPPLLPSGGAPPVILTVQDCGTPTATP